MPCAWSGEEGCQRESSWYSDPHIERTKPSCPLKLIVQLFQEQYCFQASPPDSRPHPVALLPAAIQVQLVQVQPINTALWAEKERTSESSTDLGSWSRLIDVYDSTVWTGSSTPFEHSFHVTTSSARLSETLARLLLLFGWYNGRTWWISSMIIPAWRCCSAR